MQKSYIIDLSLCQTPYTTSNPSPPIYIQIENRASLCVHPSICIHKSIISWTPSKLINTFNRNRCSAYLTKFYINAMWPRVSLFCKQSATCAPSHTYHSNLITVQNNRNIHNCVCVCEWNARDFCGICGRQHRRDRPHRAQCAKCCCGFGATADWFILWTSAPSPWRTLTNTGIHLCVGLWCDPLYSSVRVCLFECRRISNNLFKFMH